MGQMILSVFFYRTLHSIVLPPLHKDMPYITALLGIEEV